MIKLADIDSNAPNGLDKDKIEKSTKEYAKRIGEQQAVLYAEKKHSLLVIFQGMDASGKDGATKNVFANCGHAGIRAIAFKKPTEEEFAHDFLWRIHKNAPEKGEICIFNRSHYEDILIQSVHSWIDKERVHKRMNAINAYEDLLVFDNNTTILKFFMHISPERQLEKLQERIDDPEKNYKHNDSDWEERKYWAQYMSAYEYAIDNSTQDWHIVPVNQRWYRDYFIAKVVCETMESLNMKYPLLDKKG